MSIKRFIRKEKGFFYIDFMIKEKKKKKKKPKKWNLDNF